MAGYVAQNTREKSSSACGPRYRGNHTRPPFGNQNKELVKPASADFKRNEGRNLRGNPHSFDGSTRHNPTKEHFNA